MIIWNLIKKIYWFFNYLQDGRKTYFFLWLVSAGVGYIHWKYPAYFGFTKKELLYIGILTTYAMLNRNVLGKIHGSRIGRFL